MLPFGVTDAHVHLWDKSFPFEEAPQRFGKSGRPAEFLQACGSVPVDKIIHMEFGRNVLSYMREIEIVEDMAREEPRLCAMVAWAPLSLGKDGGAGKALDEIAKHPIVRGIRQAHFADPDGMAYATYQMIEGVRMLPQYGLGFALGTSYNQHKGVLRFLDAIGEDVPLVLDHMGKPPVQRPEEFDAWARDIEIMAQNKALSCKLSSLATEATDENWSIEEIAPYVRHCVQTFGWDRLIYASDWPVSAENSNPVRQVETLLAILGDCEEENLRKLFYQNANKMYRL